MFSRRSAFNEANLLCEKGLAKRESLLNFILKDGEREPAGDALSDSRDALLIRHDEGVIREVFNARYSSIELMDVRAKQTQLDLRGAFLHLIYRLYRAGRTQTPAELRRQLQSQEIETAVATIQRLRYMGNPDFDALAEFCERCAGSDEDLLAHVMDPFQLRYVLSFHRPETRALLGADKLSALMAACRRRDQAGVRQCVDGMIAAAAELPKDAPQALRHSLLELWRKGDGDLGMLTFCIAVVDAQLFEELGWESSRAFFVQLRRITGPGCEVFDAFMTDEDIDSALSISEELQQEDLIVHFRKLAKGFDTKLQRNVHRSVFATAAQPRATIPVVERAATRPSHASDASFDALAFSPS